MSEFPPNNLRDGTFMTSEERSRQRLIPQKLMAALPRSATQQRARSSNGSENLSDAPVHQAALINSLCGSTTSPAKPSGDATSCRLQ